MSNLSDSEDDDLLLLSKTTFKKSRKEKSQQIKNNNCLDQYLQEETKRNEIKIQSDILMSDTTDDNYWNRVRNAVNDDSNNRDSDDNVDDAIDDHLNDDTMLFNAEKRMKDNVLSSSGGLYLVIGVRNMFIPTRKKYNNIQLFATQDEVIKKLSSLRSPLGKRIYNKISTTGKRNPKSKKSDENNTILSNLLYYKSIVKVVKNNNDITVSRDVYDWLWSISCSGNAISTYLCEGSRRTLVDLINDSSSFNHGIDELDCGLKELFGLLSDCDSQNDKDYTHSDQKEDIHTEGIHNFLKLWCKLFENNLVVIPTPTSNKRKKNDDYQNFINVACDCLVSLLRCSIDTCFYSGLDLMKVLKQLIFFVLQFINVQLEAMKIDDKNSVVWMQDAATKIATNIFQSIPKPIVNTDDADDPNSFIAFSLALRNIPICDTHGNVIVFCAKFKAQMVKVALEEICCLGKDDEKHLLLKNDFERLGLCKNTNTSTNDKVEVLSWQDCIIASKKAYHDLEHNISEYVTSGPRFYATICLANACTDMADTLFYHPLIHSNQQGDTTVDTSSSSIYSEEDGDIMSSSMETLEFHCTNIKQQIKSVFTHPHLRRAKEVLTWCSTKYRHAKVDLCKKVSVKKQRTLDVWIDNDRDDEMEEEEENHEGDKDLNDENKEE